jgi:hypothetical protein
MWHIGMQSIQWTLCVLVSCDPPNFWADFSGCLLTMNTLLNPYFVQTLGFSRLRKFYFRKKEFALCSEIMVCSAVWFEGFQFRPWRYSVRLIKVLHVLVCPLLTCVIHLYQIRFCLFCRLTVIFMAVSLQLQRDKLFVRDNLILRTDVCRLASGQESHLSFLYF